MKKYITIFLLCFLHSQDVEVIIPLHTGANLISFNILPENTSLENIFAPIEDYITGIISEGTAASLNPILGWVGSLEEIESLQGYWLIVNDNCNLIIQGSQVNSNQTYQLNYGANLISYPFNISMDLNNALPTEAIWNINGIIGEGTAATNLNGQFIGSLSQFQPQKGYWFFIQNPFTFNYYDITTECDFMIEEAQNDLEEIFFNIYNDPNIIECYENLGENPWCIDELIDFNNINLLYSNILNICPNSESANFGFSMVNLMSIINNGHFLNLIEKWSNFLYGFDNQESTLLFNPGIGIVNNASAFTNIEASYLSSLIQFNQITPYGMLLNQNREEIPELREIQEIIQNILLPRSITSIASLEKVINKDYTFMISGQMQGDIYQSDIEMDDTEFYLLKTYLHLIKSIFHIILTYDINGPTLSFDNYLWMNQDSSFLTIRDEMIESMPNAFQELQYLHSSLESSFNFLSNESDWQQNDYIDNSVLDDDYDNILNQINELEIFISGDYIFNDYICSAWECYVVDTLENYWEIECDCNEGSLIETTTNISNFMNNPPNDLKEKVPRYTIINSSCDLDGYTYTCPQLIWDADNYFEWYAEFLNIDYSINGLFPDLTIDDVVSTYFLIFNLNEESWTKIIGGN